MTQFQMVMKGLNDAVRSNYNPRNFCSVFKNIDGSNIDVNEQMDADEFFNNLMDKLENELKKNGQEGIIPRTFGGRLVQEIISSECNHRSTVESKFLTLSIEVKSMTSIIQSLERMVAGEILEGENKYSCESCQKKVKARKRESISKLPNKLIFVLKRFDFRYETYTKSKLNSYCEFPEKIDMRKYSQQYLNEDQQSKPDGYFNFNLRGVTIHRGTAESGHYYSFIRDKHGKWFEFNDTNIRPFDTQNLPESAFGVENEGDSLWSRGTRVGNAYMLFYERDAIYDEEDNPISTLLDGLKLSSNSMHSYTTEKIMNENFEYYLKRVFFDNTYFDFVIDQVATVGVDQLHASPNNSLMMLAFSTFLILLLRRKQKDRIPPMYKHLCNLLKASREAAFWLLQNASSTLFVQEFLVDCLIPDMKILVYGLLAQALHTLLASPESAPLDPASLAVADNLLRLLVKEAKIHEPAVVDREKYLVSVYRLINLCSKHAELRQSLSDAALPNALPYLLHLKPKQELELLDAAAVQPAEVEGLFKGYHRYTEKHAMTLEEKDWKKKGELKVKNDFKVDSSYLIAAGFRVLKQEVHRYPDTVAFFVDQHRWVALLDHCHSTEAKRELCECVILHLRHTPELFPKLLEELQARILEIAHEAYRLKGITYFYRVFSRMTDGSEGNRKMVSSFDPESGPPQLDRPAVRQDQGRVLRLHALHALPRDAQQQALLREDQQERQRLRGHPREWLDQVRDALPQDLQQALRQPVRRLQLDLRLPGHPRVRAAGKRKQEAPLAPARARPPGTVPGVPRLHPLRLRRRVHRRRPDQRSRPERILQHLEAQDCPPKPGRASAARQPAGRQGKSLDSRRRRKAGPEENRDARVPIQNRWHLIINCNSPQSDKN